MAFNGPTAEFRHAELSDTTANWTTNDPVLASGEWAYDETVKKVKIGDGVTQWTLLPYQGDGGDHGQLGGLGDDDHPQYHDDARGDVRYYRKTELDSGQLDNRYYTESEVDTQQQAQDSAIALKYDTSNPAGYETPAQLNARDAASRARGNHTGTQLAATISDLAAAVQAAETNTSLTLVGNELRFLREDGTTQAIDLTIYLDDSNAARIESGVVNNTTGIATFTRDDASTFTVDMSAFLDGISAHSALSGLLNDDHTQYHNDARGDIRYYTKALLDGGQLDNRYFTEAEVNASQAAQDSAINGNTSNISANTGAAAANTGAIAALQSEQSTQNTAIGLNTAKVSADGPISSHSDVNTAGAVTGDQLVFEMGQWQPRSLLNGFTVFPIWAEESGGLTNGNAQFSFGNGATGDIGIPIGTDCELFAVGINADAVGTSVSLNFRKFTTTVHTQLFDNFTDESQLVVLSTPVPFSIGDVLTFETNTETGAFSDVRAVGWFRQKASAVFPTTQREVATAQNIGFTATTWADIPGMTADVTITDVGTVEGVINYSASRSGAANAEAEFRITIGTANGFPFPDTLSTFNDNGSSKHSLSGLAAGTYTVTAQCQTTQPINIAAVALTVTGVED